MALWTGDQPPEGRLIEEAAKASGRSTRFLAANAHMSDTRWRQIIRGWQPSPEGERAVHAPPLTLARMAWAVGLDSDALEKVGRADAAGILVDLQRRFPHNWQRLPLPETTVDDNAGLTDTVSAQLIPTVRPGGPDEIDLIYASQQMSAREKLLRIRQVLELRAQAEAEETRMHEAAPADPAGAEEASQN
jgi:hypothetical protein